MSQSNSSDGIDFTGPYLAPRDVQHLARNIVATALDPMWEEVHIMRGMMTRLFGHDDDSGIPVKLRSKGILAEIQEAQSATNELLTDMVKEVRVGSQQLKDQEASNQIERIKIIGMIEAQNVEIAAIKRGNQKLRRMLVVIWRWLTRKDDGLSVFLVKIAGFITLGTVVGVALSHGVTWALHLLKLILVNLYERAQ